MIIKNLIDSLSQFRFNLKKKIKKIYQNSSFYDNKISRTKDIKARLLYGDSLSYVRIAKKIFDYIYIDFMFEKKNNAKPSKNDLFLRSINYNENNKLSFIEEMINYCKKRIIVKEPIKSKSKIIDCDFEIKTKLIKYKIFNGKLGK